MPEVPAIFDLVTRVPPFDCLQAGFMRQALAGLLLLAPMSAAMGVQVVNFRMSFFADALSHATFAGVALGLILAVDPLWSVPVFGLLVGLAIVTLQRRSALATDAIIGVAFAAVVAFGLAMVSRDRAVARDMARYLYGDILAITSAEMCWLALLFAAVAAFETWGYNRLLYAGLNPALAAAHRVRVALYQYLFAGLLALLVALSVRVVGVLLVTALLVVPAAAARNFARSAGGMFWWAQLVGVTSAVAGLIVSAQDWARTATGATIVLAGCAWFLVSWVVALARGTHRR